MPDVLDWIELGTLCRQRDDSDAVRHLELSGGVPSGLVHQHDRVSSRCDGERYLGKVQGHGLCVAERQDEASALTAFGADRAKDVGRLRSLVLGRRRPSSAPCPASRDLVLLAHPGLVLEPDLYGCAFREGSPDLCQLASEAPFLNASRACSFWAWWRGRAVSFT